MNYQKLTVEKENGYVVFAIELILFIVLVLTIYRLKSSRESTNVERGIGYWPVNCAKEILLWR